MTAKLRNILVLVIGILLVATYAVVINLINKNNATKEQAFTEAEIARADYHLLNRDIDISDNPLADNVDWNFDKSSGTLSIYGSGNMKSFSFIRNPSSAGLEESEEEKSYHDDLCPWYGYRSLIKNIVIGDEIESISWDAFDGLIYVENVEWPDSVINISYQGSFQDSPYYKECLENKLIDDKLVICGTLLCCTSNATKIDVKDVYYISGNAFVDSSVEEIHIAPGVISVDEAAFWKKNGGLVNVYASKKQIEDWEGRIGTENVNFIVSD